MLGDCPKRYFVAVRVKTEQRAYQARMNGPYQAHRWLHQAADCVAIGRFKKHAML